MDRESWRRSSPFELPAVHLLLRNSKAESSHYLVIVLSDGQERRVSMNAILRQNRNHEIDNGLIETDLTRSGKFEKHSIPLRPGISTTPEIIHT